jgi:hypothetical protein
MSKYAQLRALMGGTEQFNDKVSTGRVLKWFADTAGADKATRDKVAKEVREKLQHLGYVQKVQVRNWKTGRAYYVGEGKGDNGGDYMVSSWLDTDKICVYVDTSKM